MSGATLERRLANYRSAIRAAGGASASDREPGDRLDGGVVRGSIELGRRLAEALDGELVLDPGGPVVRVEPATVVLPIDRPRLATLPGMPPADAPLLCIDTETTGLATASGTVAFLIGLAWIVVFYVTDGSLPIDSLDNWNIVVGFGFIAAGFGVSTQWK